MAKYSVSISLLIVMACFGVMSVTTEGKQEAAPIMTNRQSRHIFLFPQTIPENDLPSFESEYNPYNHPAMNNVPTEGSFTNERSEARIPSIRFNRPVTSSSIYSGDSDTTGGRTFGGFPRFFGSQNGPLCPQCPQCPAFPVIPPCPNLSCPAPASCPLLTTQGDTTITLTPQQTECGTMALTGTDSLSPCAKVSAATRGDIDVTFTVLPSTPPGPPAAQVVSIGIVAVPPNTQVKLKCSAIPVGTGAVAKTQNGDIVAGSTVTITGFVQIVAALTGVNTGKTLKCSWTSIP